MVVDTSAPMRAPSDVDRLFWWLTITLLTSTALATTYILWAAPGGENNPSQSVAFGPPDIVLFLLVVASAADVIERRTFPSRRWALPTALLGVTVAWFAIAFLAHPSWRGVEWFLRIAGTWAIAYAIHRVGFKRRIAFLVAMVIFAVGQAALGIAQHLNGGAVGLDALEWNTNWQRIGGSTFGRGSFTNSYHLAALLVVSIGAAVVLLHQFDRTRWRWLVHASLFVMAVGIALTFSRTVFFSLIPIVGLVFVSRHGRSAAVVIVAGVAVGVLVGLGGYASKAGQVTDPNRIDSGRIAHLEDASLLVTSEPVFGVGPGRYVIALREVDYSFILAPPHNFAAQAAAEAGVIGGVLALATLASFGWWLLHQGLISFVTGIALVPFLLLDWFPYASPIGLVLSGFWLGILWVTLNQAAHPPPSHTKESERRRDIPV